MPSKKKPAKRRTTTRAARTMTKKDGTSMSLTKTVRIRMYRQGLGDCFLLSFGGEQGLSEAAHVLIDCGTLGATTTGVRMADVAQDICVTTGKRLALLIATHEHLDHLSGFNSQRDAFDSLDVGHVWVAWTEDPSDKLAKKLQKYSGDLKMAALAASQALEKAAEGFTVPGAAKSRRAASQTTQNPQGSTALAMAQGVKEVLSFFGDVDTLGATFAKGVDEAMKYVASRAGGQNREYLKPGTFLQPDWLPGVTVYVLGPPHDETKIKNMGEHGNPELYELSAGTVTGFAATARWFVQGGSRSSYYCSLGTVEEREKLELSLPFDRRFQVAVGAEGSRFASYFDRANAWRSIETDWLFASADFALQLDNLTNNTSLALAFEICEGGPVILMAADAQLGNWLSWHDYTWEVPSSKGQTRAIKAKDLLARTLVYKVGHHSSHNATAVAHGLEMMTNESLVALIPLDKKVAIKKKWPMPAKRLYERLLEKTKGRVLRSDIGWPEDSTAPESVPAKEWKRMPPGVEVKEQDSYIDVLLSF
jgi:hypothetical protein